MRPGSWALFALFLLGHAAFARSLWMVDDAVVTRIDSQTGAIATRPLDRPVRGLAPTQAAGAWLLQEDRIVHLDDDLAVQAYVALPADLPADRLVAVQPDDDSVWIAAGTRLLHFTAQAQTLGEWTLGASASALVVAGPDAIFVGSARALHRYDSMGRVVAQADLDPAAGEGTHALIIDAPAGLLWVVRDRALVQLDVLAGLTERGALRAALPDALALAPLSGMLVAITGQEVVRYTRDRRIVAPPVFASEPLSDLAGIALNDLASWTWFGDRAGLGAIDVGTGAVIRMPNTLAVLRLADMVTRVVPRLEVIDIAPDVHGDILIRLRKDARCDGVPCVEGTRYLDHLRLDAADSAGSLMVESTAVASDILAAHVTPANLHDGSFAMWLRDPYGNRSPPVRVDARASEASRVTAKAAPTVSITAPANNSTFTAPLSTTITATAAAGTGAIVTKVDFFSNGALIGSSTTSPYRYTWSNVQAGSYVLTAKVTDSLGAAATSSAVNVLVSAGTPARPIAAWLFNDGWAGTAVVSDAYGAHNGTPSGTLSAVVAPPSVPKPDTCKAVSVAGGSVDVAGLALSTSAGARTSVASWLYWNGVDAAMPLGWANQALWFSAGAFGFGTRNGDVFGIASSGMANRWVHVVAEFTNGGVATNKLYVNGVPQVLTQRVGTPIVSNAVVGTALRLGGLAGATGFRFDGQLDEVKLFNRALTPVEVSAEFALANACAAAPTAVLTSPANLSNYIAPATINLSATASPGIGTSSIGKVEFFNGATLLGTSTTAPYAFSWTAVPVGTYTLKAKATDTKGATTTSASASVTVKANVGPTVTLTAPANNALFVAPAAISLAATAGDADGMVAKVEFFQGATRLATVTAAPYTYAWTNVAGGIYSLTAKATDDRGAVSTSSVVSVKVDKPPTVSLTSPVNNSVVVLPATISLAATAADSDGTIARVEFLRDGVVMATDTASPYSFAWTNATPGTYVLTARATDNLGVSATSAPVTVSVKANQPPTVALTSPATGARLIAGSPVTFAASALDADGSIAKVDFYAEGATRTLLGSDASAPYSVVASLPAGTVALTAVAMDNKGVTAASDPVVVFVAANQRPTVTLTAPVKGQIVVAPGGPPTVSLAATAADPDGRITAVRFYAQLPSDPAPTLLGSVSAAPYQLSWPSVPYNVGPDAYAIYAEAIDDSGASSDWDDASFRVLTATPRSVRIAAPRDGRFNAPATIVLVAVSDIIAGNDPVARVDFLDNGTVVATVTAANGANGEYAATWRNVPAGNYAIVARLTDIYGSSTLSDPVLLTVGVPPALPTTALQSPTNGLVTVQGASTSLGATLVDPSALSRWLAFTDNYQLLATVASPPYGYTWTNPSAGVHRIVAQAQDVNFYALGESSPAFVIVPLLPLPPAATMTAPSPGASYTSAGAVPLAVDAQVLTNAITQVSFYEGPTLLGTRASAPYALNTYFNPGNHTVRALVQTNTGASTVTTPVTFAVSGTGAGTGITLAAPTTGQVFYAPAAVTLTASVTDPAHLVSRVDFYQAATRIGSIAQAPYSMTWSNVAAGQYAITAVAVYSSGGTVSTGATTISVRVNSPPRVTITAPVAGGVVPTGQPIALNAAASDSDGSIAKVDFFAGATRIGSAATAPYSMSWNGAVAGAYTLTAVATDNAGASVTSAAVPIQVVANAAPSVALVSPRANQAFSSAGAVPLAAIAADADGTVARVDFYADGVLVASALGAPFASSWSAPTAGPHVLTARATDNLGTVAQSAPVNITVAALSLNVGYPVESLSIPADFTIVRGTYQAPPNSGVTVNGIVAQSDGRNFFVNNLRLVDGANTISVTLTTADGSTVSQVRNVVRSGAAPFQVTAEPDNGMVSFSATLRYGNRTGSPVTQAAYSTGCGGAGASRPTGDILGTVTLSAAGVCFMTVTLTDTDGATYSQEVGLSAQDATAVDQLLKAGWADFTGALAAGDTAMALQGFSRPGQLKYKAILEALAPHMRQIVPQWSPPQTGAIMGDVGEFAITRLVNGTPHVFFVYFIKDQNGVWRLDSM